MPYASNQGIRIHYEVEGEGPPLVLVHARFTGVEMWRQDGYHYVNALKGDYRPILVEPGDMAAATNPMIPKPTGSLFGSAISSRCWTTGESIRLTFSATRWEGG